MPQVRRVVISNLNGREREVKALAAHFKVTAVRDPNGGGDYVFIEGSLDFFLAQLRQAGFEFEEQTGEEGKE